MGTKKVNNPTKAMTTSRSAGRLRLKGQINPDTMIEGNARTLITADAAGNASGAARLDMTAPGVISTVGGLYQQYLFRPGTAFNYVPSVGLTTSGNILVGWLDNPEVMAAYLSANTAARATIVQSLANTKIYPIWQQFSYPLTSAPRLKKFDVNGTIVLSTPDELQRSSQGFFVFSVINAPPNTQVSFSFTHCKVQLWNLTNNYGT